MHICIRCRSAHATNASGPSLPKHQIHSSLNHPLHSFCTILIPPPWKIKSKFQGHMGLTKSQGNASMYRSLFYFRTAEGWTIPFVWWQRCRVAFATKNTDVIPLSEEKYCCVTAQAHSEAEVLSGFFWSGQPPSCQICESPSCCILFLFSSSTIFVWTPIFLPWPIIKRLNNGWKNCECIIVRSPGAVHLWSARAPSVAWMV